MPARRVDGRVRRRRLAVLVAVLAVLVVTFFLGQQVASPIGLFEYEGDVALATYTVVYALYLGLTMARMLWLAVRSLSGTRNRLRAGMAVFAVGCVLGLVGLLACLVLTVANFPTLIGGSPGLATAIGAVLVASFVVGVVWSLRRPSVLSESTGPTTAPAA